MTEVYVNNRPREDVHSYPRPPALQVVPLRLRVIWTDAQSGKETTIADTESKKGEVEGKVYAYRVLETTHPPTYYISPEVIDTSLLTKTARSSYCEWKGVASYYNFKPPGSSSSSIVREKVWSYPSPTKGTKFAPLAGFLSFYAASGSNKAGSWRCLVEGEEVTAQEGDFYGGWKTSEIVGRMKGGPGTYGW